MNINSWMLVFAIFVTALSAALAYSASPRQRWLRMPLPAFPTRVSAMMAAMVGLKAWSEALPLFM